MRDQLGSSLPYPFIALLNQIHGHHALLEIFVVLHKGLGRQFSPQLIGLCDDLQFYSMVLGTEI